MMKIKYCVPIKIFGLCAHEHHEKNQYVSTRGLLSLTGLAIGREKNLCQAIHLKDQDIFLENALIMIFFSRFID